VELLFHSDSSDVKSDMDEAFMLIKKRKYSRRVTSNIFIFVINNGLQDIIKVHKLLA